MIDPQSALQLSRPSDVRLVLGHWLRSARQRLQLTQPMLAKKSSVPVSTLSRMERNGEGSIESLLRLLHALGELDGVNDFIQAQIRRALLPTDLSKLQQSTRPRQRVRVRVRVRVASHKEKA